MPTERTAAAILAAAIADAINPERPARTAPIGNALLQPLAIRTVQLLKERGWLISEATPDTAKRSQGMR